jgi:hypothetical protein
MPSSIRTPLIRLATIFTIALAPQTVWAEDAVRVEPVERWSNVFGGRDMVFRFAVHAPRAFDGRAAWAFTIDRAVVARREANLTATPDRPGTVTVRYPLPPVREGVVLRGQLVVRILGPDDKERTRVEKTVWIFPESPFAGRAAWLAARKITLFDPAKTTAAVWKKAGIPFTEQENAAALADLREGMLVIGEGASFKEEPGLAETMQKLAARGVPVLCLAPAEGVLPLPRSLQASANVTLRRRSIITRLDKRLDAAAWPSDGQVVFSSLALSAEEGGLAAEVKRAEGKRQHPEGWPWLEMEFEKDHGRLLVCGFGIIKHWSDGPTPRFLLARLLERMAEGEGTQREKK